MNLKKTKLAVILLLLSILGQAQINKKEKKYNPFESIGKKGEVLTAYGDKFIENFDTDSVQRIGSVLINIYQKRIVMLLDADSTFQKVSDNSSASRWYSVDPLAAKGKNISHSPYTFVFNNPINYIDPDGQDGIRVIDEKNKTVTIKAVYYVQSSATTYMDGKKERQLSGYSAKEIAGMQENYNKYLNGLGASISEGDYKGYTVKFDLQFKEGGSSTESREKANNEMEGGFPIGNSFINENSTMNPRFTTVETDNGDGTTSTRTVGGTTESSKYITMNTGEDTKMNRIHEIFHTLGLTHPRGTGGTEKGIMRYPPAKPSQAEINQVGNASFLPVVILKEKEKE